ncbi:hypothetical protein FMUND_12206 [Fusarium mundagurra]|uniref:Uncharacterized protein n=1 Tax=Fusarium mundagurra TaxID=1567541 RepID=A0A8H5Y4U0_9HYPO|nr:hypothetical protein FMUND_12206 [Fusarium mundagurra]
MPSPPLTDCPTIPGVALIPILSAEKFHTGFAMDRNHNPLNGGLGGYVGKGNDKIEFRSGLLPFTPEGSKVFAEAGTKFSPTTTLYGGARGTSDSGGLADAGIWAGVAKEFNKNFTGGVKVERSIKRTETQPTTSVNFWTLFKW